MFKPKILKSSDAAVYAMPTLEDESIPQSEVMISQRIEESQRQAYEEGFESGEKAGFTEGTEKASVLIDRLSQIIEEVTEFKKGLVKDVQEQVVNLAIAIARQVIAEEINTRPEIIVNVVKEALNKLQRQGTIKIRINPALHELFIRKKPELSELHEDIAFDVSSNIPLTGPLVTSQTEEVVTDIEEMISNVTEGLRKNLGNN